MKTVVSLGFAGEAQAVQPLIPPEFAFLQVRDYKVPYSIRFPTGASQVVPPHLIEPLIAWGRRARYQDGPLVRTIALDDQYDVSDLEGQAVVEMETTVNHLELANFAAFEAHYLCAHCNRMRWSQTGDLALRGRPKPDLQMTISYDWVASPKAQVILSEFGVRLRPLRNKDAFQQVQIEEAVEVLDVPPMEIVDTCPGCGRHYLYRSDWLEGSEGAMTLLKVLPLTLREVGGRVPTLAQSDEVFNRDLGWTEEPHNRAGAKLRLERGDFALRAHPYFFASATLVRRLFEEGVKGIRFRPVHIAA